MIWDFIRDFLVQYVFGGTDSQGFAYDTTVGLLSNEEVISSELVYKVGHSTGGSELYLSISDWLSTTATIIIMCLAVFLMIMLVRWVWRLITSAFLLK